MAKIELRKDGWFEAGKDAEKSFPFAYKAYLAKQQIEKALKAINRQKLDKPNLESMVRNLQASYPFKGTLHVRGSDIYVDTHGLPGEAYLGQIMDK